MISKNQIKLIKSLQNNKNRNDLGLFLVEGTKNTLELLNSDFQIKELFITEEFLTKNEVALNDKDIKYNLITQDELEKTGSLESNDSALAIVKQKENSVLKIEDDEMIIALDEIKDPGNLGTIIRIADWYGIKKIVASGDTVDFYNPKVISATKGSFIRVQIFYTDLEKFLSNTKIPILGAFLDGKNIHKFNFPKAGILVMGNESRGIGQEIEKCVTQKITIPSFGGAESLNVAIATAVILDNWKR
jgi:RNA methyltransferase, TrmH family